MLAVSVAGVAMGGRVVPISTPAVGDGIKVSGRRVPAVELKGTKISSLGQ